MKKIKTAKLKDEKLIYISPEENKEFYFEFIKTMIFSLYDAKIINQIQYELCEKELFNKKYNL